MNLLALETSSARGSIALLHGERVSEAFIDSAREQTARLLPLLGHLLAEAGLELARLDGISFGRGPGSFTGLRIAAAAAQGLAMSVALPLAPVSSLAALAQGAWRLHGAKRALVCVDARMGEVYSAAFEVRGGVVAAVGPERIGSPEAVPGLRELDVLEGGCRGGDRSGDRDGGGWVAVGSGFGVHREILEPLLVRAERALPDLLPAARDLLPLARREVEAGRTVPPEAALPAYLRDEEAWRRF